MRFKPLFDGFTKGNIVSRAIAGIVGQVPVTNIYTGMVEVILNIIDGGRFRRVVNYPYILDAAGYDTFQATRKFVDVRSKYDN